DLDVARVVGVETVLPGRILRVEAGLATVAVGSVEFVAVPPEVPAEEVFVCVRGEDVVLLRDGAAGTSARNRLVAVVRSLAPDGPLVRVGLDCGFPLTALVTRPACEELGLHEGAAVTALLKAPSVHLIARAAGPTA